LLECDSMTAEIGSDGTISLRFSNGFGTSLKPVYESGTLRVRYNNAGYNMSWQAVPGADGTVCAVYDDYCITFEKIN